MVATPDWPDEKALVEAAQEDPARFLELYDRHFHRVYLYALRRVGRRAVAEDVTAEAFRRALEHIKQFEWRGTPFVAWLFRIAAHALVDHWKREKREAGPSSGAEPLDPGFERTVMLFQLVDRSVRL